MIRLKEIKESVLHLLFPHTCAGCGSDLINIQSQLCLRCTAGLPVTAFHDFPGNPVEKIFTGRLPLVQAAAEFYFTKESLMQRLMHQFKYRGNKELGFQLGRMMGLSLKKSARFNDIDLLIPLPLFPSKERKRGFNQAALLCEGIADVFPHPVLPNIISRPQFTETQTRKGRLERWKNMEGKFELLDPGKIVNKHILLIDDVVTTGATLEACGTELLGKGTCRLSIATLCIASD